MSENTANTVNNGAADPGLLAELTASAGETLATLTVKRKKTPKGAEKTPEKGSETVPAGETPEKGSETVPAGETPKGAEKTPNTTVTLPSATAGRGKAPTVRVYPIGVAVTLGGNVYRVRILSRNTSDASVRVAIGTGDDVTIPANPTAERIPSHDLLEDATMTLSAGLARFTADHSTVCDSLVNHPVIGADVATWEGTMINGAVTGERDDVFPMGAGEVSHGTFTRTPEGWTFTREGNDSPMVIQGGTNKGAVWTFSADVATWEGSAVTFRAFPPVGRARAIYREAITALSGVAGLMARTGGAGAVGEILSHVVNTLRAFPPVAGG